MKVSGTPMRLYGLSVRPHESTSTGNVRFRPLTNGGMSLVVVTRSMLTAKMTSPSFSKFLFRISMEGISSRHGLHHVAQKFRKTTFPRKSESRYGFSFRSESEKSGAGLPTASGSYFALCSQTRVKTAIRMVVPTPRINRRERPCAGSDVRFEGVDCSAMVTQIRAGHDALCVGMQTGQQEVDSPETENDHQEAEHRVNGR